MSDSTTSALNELDELLPIREVARITGVNPVTLRAWERRYGLIQPERTPKGHRLYSKAQVARIQAVLTWLERGVAVSQVKALLNQSSITEPIANSLWTEQQTFLSQAIEQLDERGLDEHFNHALALYPATTLYQQLLSPLLYALEHRWYQQPNAAVEQGFFYTWLRTKLSTRIYHSNRLRSGQPLLLINLDPMPMSPGLWLCAWLLNSADCPVQIIDWPLPSSAWSTALANIAPRALLLYGQNKLGADQQQWLQQPEPVTFLCGRTVCFHRSDFDRSDLHLIEDPLDAVQTLQHLGVLDQS